jgi:hypothetical protein
MEEFNGDWDFAESQLGPLGKILGLMKRSPLPCILMVQGGISPWKWLIQRETFAPRIYHHLAAGRSTGVPLLTSELIFPWIWPGLVLIEWGFVPEGERLRGR